MSDVAQLSDAELQELLLHPPDTRRRGDRPLLNEEALWAWAKEFDVRFGRQNALPAQDLYRHFEQWATPLGHRVIHAGANLSRWFGLELARLGLTRKGRATYQGRETRPYQMSATSAEEFLRWREDNPHPPGLPRWTLRTPRKAPDAEASLAVAAQS